MAAASIVIDQGALSAGIASQSRDDLATGAAVTLSNDVDTGVRSWRWELLSIPRGSSATLSNPILPTATFTPDVVGTYRVRLTVNDGNDGQRDVRVAIVRDGNGLRVPAKGEAEEANYDTGSGLNLDGYWPDMAELLDRTRTLVAAAVPNFAAVLAVGADTGGTDITLGSSSRVLGDSVTGSTGQLALGTGYAETNATVSNNPGGASIARATVGSAVATQTVSWNLVVQDGTRNPRAKFFLTDDTAGSGAWGLWQTFSSGGAQPFVIGVGSDTIFSVDASGNAQVYEDLSVDADTRLAGTLTASGAVVLDGHRDAGALAATVNDWNPGGSWPAVAVVDGGANGSSTTITGLDATGVSDGQMVIIQNTSGARNITLAHQDAGSSAANRFFCDGGTDYLIGTTGAVMVVYSSLAGGWRVIGS